MMKANYMLKNCWNMSWNL